jgi:hypothetical protein
VQNGAAVRTIRVVLVADDAAETTVSSTVEVSTADPRWPAWLVDAIALHAQEGARQLRNQLVAQQAITGLGAGEGFVPLAAVVPCAAGR